MALVHISEIENVWIAEWVLSILCMHTTYRNAEIDKLDGKSIAVKIKFFFVLFHVFFLRFRFVPIAAFTLSVITTFWNVFFRLINPQSTLDIHFGRDFLLKFSICSLVFEFYICFPFPHLANDERYSLSDWNLCDFREYRAFFK